MSTDIKLPKTQISKIVQSVGSFLNKIASPIMKVAVAFIKNILALSVITATVSAIDAGTQKKIHGSETKTLIFWNEEMMT